MFLSLGLVHAVRTDSGAALPPVIARKKDQTFSGSRAYPTWFTVARLELCRHGFKKQTMW
jgi:hypothetical protein